MTAVRAMVSSGRRDEAALLGLAAVAVVVFCVWCAHDGGFAPEQWLPGTLLVVALAVTSLASAEVRRRLAAAPLAPVLFGLYALWSFASIGWAQVRGDAWDGANRTLLYAAVFALFAGLPLGRTSRLALVSAWAFAVAGIGFVDFLRAAAASAPHGFFVVGRLAVPIAYPNANAAVFGMAFLPLQVLASRREVHAAVRTAAVLASTVLIELLVVCQSRGSIVALALALVVYLAVGRNLLRALPLLAVTGAAALAALPRLLHVYTAVIDGNGYGAALSSARTALIASTVAAAVVGALVVALDLRVRVPESVCTVLRRTVLGAAVLAGAAGVAVVLAFGHPVARAHRAWHDFTTNKQASPQTIHLASGVGTSRYDVFRIALHEFAAHPIGGDGSDNYLVPYLQQRHTGETSRYPESVVLRALSETGIVGAVLFFGFLVLAVRSAVRAVRREPAAGAALAALVGFAYWFLHASVDWLWEFPGLAAPAFAFLALAAGTGNGREVAPRPARARPGRRLALVAGAGIVTVAAAVSLICPWIAVRDIDTAVNAQAATPAVYSLLHTASRWNPLSEEAAVAEATIAANAGDRVRERKALEAALRRNSHDWYLYLMLGIIDGREHKSAAARAHLAQARKLSPLDPVVIFAQRRLRWGFPLTEREVGDIFLLRSRTMRGAVQK